jgi:Na+-translocating ferredoxin:NAD+ oxidoreductase RNF subunit RnfB
VPESQGGGVGVVTWIVLALLFVVGAAGAVALAPHGHPPVPPDPIASAVLSVLPGGNCGACGNDSCYDAAMSVAKGTSGPDVCVTGGTDTEARVRERLERGEAR